MQENLEAMIKSLKETNPIQNLNGINEMDMNEIDTNMKEKNITEENTKNENSEGLKVQLSNFYDWYEKNEKASGIYRVKTEVSKINSKDSMIFKIKKGKSEEEMELVSFYNPLLRSIIDLPPVYLNIFKNDTFVALHCLNDEIFIKSYGVKNGLIVVYCANVDNRIIPFQQEKIKKNVDSMTLMNFSGEADRIRARLNESVDIETLHILYKQTIKLQEIFTTKTDVVDWFLKRQKDVIDINHLLKIDNVLRIIV